MVQKDLNGRTIEEQDEAIQKCLKYTERKASMKTIRPGTYFNISISDKENEALDEIGVPIKQRAFIIKKMKPREVLPVNGEGKAFQDDLELFMKVVFVTGTAHMSPETYEALMAERKPGGEPQQELTTKPECKKKPGKKSVVEGLKEKFGEKNVKVEVAS